MPHEIMYSTTLVSRIFDVNQDTLYTIYIVISMIMMGKARIRIVIIEDGNTYLANPIKFSFRKEIFKKNLFFNKNHMPISCLIDAH